MLGTLVLSRRGDGMDLEAAGIECPAEAADDTALAGSIPTLEHDERTFWGAEIGLLDELQRPLQGREPPFVVGVIHFGVRLDRRKPRAARNDETSGLHETSPLREVDTISQLQIEDQPVGNLPRGLCQSFNPRNDRGARGANLAPAMHTQARS